MKRALLIAVLPLAVLVGLGIYFCPYVVVPKPPDIVVSRSGKAVMDFGFGGRSKMQLTITARPGLAVRGRRHAFRRIEMEGIIFVQIAGFNLRPQSVVKVYVIRARSGSRLDTVSAKWTGVHANRVSYRDTNKPLANYGKLSHQEITSRGVSMLVDDYVEFLQPLSYNGEHLRTVAVYREMRPGVVVVFTYAGREGGWVEQKSEILRMLATAELSSGRTR